MSYRKRSLLLSLWLVAIAAIDLQVLSAPRSYVWAASLVTLGLATVVAFWHEATEANIVLKAQTLWWTYLAVGASTAIAGAVLRDAPLVLTALWILWHCWKLDPLAWRH